LQRKRPDRQKEEIKFMSLTLRSPGKTILDVLREARSIVANCEGPQDAYEAILDAAIIGEGVDFVLFDKAIPLLKKQIGSGSITDWNDRQSSRQPVLDAFDRAIEKEEARQAKRRKKP
jgi:hypothetical protein